MKVTIEELLTQIKEYLKEDDSDLALSLLENATDTLTGDEDTSEVEAKIAEAVKKTEDEWRQKYHSRFYSGESEKTEEVKSEDFEETKEPEESEESEETMEEFFEEKEED